MALHATNVSRHRTCFHVLSDSKAEFQQIVQAFKASGKLPCIIAYCMKLLTYYEWWSMMLIKGIAAFPLNRSFNKLCFQSYRCLVHPRAGRCSWRRRKLMERCKTTAEVAIWIAWPSLQVSHRGGDQDMFLSCCCAHSRTLLCSRVWCSQLTSGVSQKRVLVGGKICSFHVLCAHS